MSIEDSENRSRAKWLEPMNPMAEAQSKRRPGVIGLAIAEGCDARQRVREVLDSFQALILAKIEMPQTQTSGLLMIVAIAVDTDQLGAITGKLGLIAGVKVKSLLL